MTEDTEEDVCAHCGQSLGYRSAVSRGIVDTLKAVAAYVMKKGVNVVHLKKEMVEQKLITVTQYGNRTHMVRLGLLESMRGEPGNFMLTSKAMEFLYGHPIPKSVRVTKRTDDERSHTVEESDELCTIGQFAHKNVYWDVPNFEIREGRVIPGNPQVTTI